MVCFWVIPLSWDSTYHLLRYWNVISFQSFFFLRNFPRLRMCFFHFSNPKDSSLFIRYWPIWESWIPLCRSAEGIWILSAPIVISASSIFRLFVYGLSALKGMTKPVQDTTLMFRGPRPTVLLTWTDTPLGHALARCTKPINRKGRPAQS